MRTGSRTPGPARMPMHQAHRHSILGECTPVLGLRQSIKPCDAAAHRSEHQRTSPPSEAAPLYPVLVTSIRAQARRWRGEREAKGGCRLLGRVQDRYKCTALLQITRPIPYVVAPPAMHTLGYGRRVSGGQQGSRRGTGHPPCSATEKHHPWSITSTSFPSRRAMKGCVADRAGSTVAETACRDT